MSLPVLLLILFCGVSTGRISLKDNLEEFDELMRKKEFELREATRSHRASLEKIQSGNSSSCPSECLERRGDGHCDSQCNTGRCLVDYGDCSHFPSCSSHSCPRDECRWKCALKGCENGFCQLSEDGPLEFFWALLPAINPQKIFRRFVKIEQKLKQQLGIAIILQSDQDGPIIFGRRPDTHQLARMRYLPHSLFEITTDHEIDESSLVLFAINSTSIINMRDSHAIDILRRLGSSRIVAKIFPFTLSKEERKAFLPDGLFAQRYLSSVRNEHKRAEAKWNERAKEGRNRRYLLDSADVHF